MFMFMLSILLLTSVYPFYLFASEKPTIYPVKAEQQTIQPISFVKSPINIDPQALRNSTTRTCATKTLHRLQQLTLEESASQSPMQKPSHALDYKQDSIITNGVYGAGL